MTKRVAIAGASGYAGGEAARLVSAHPELDLVTVTGHSSAGKTLGEIHPHLASLAHMSLQDTSVEILSGHDVVILALPHGASGTLGHALAEASTQSVLVDLGADRRLASVDDWDAYYGGEYFGPWTYGLPELVVRGAGKQREALRGATRIAAPGCNAQAVTLGIAPLIAHGAIMPKDIVTTLAVGPSGAGKSARVDLLASELMGSAKPYAIGGLHRHIPEIRQNLVQAGGSVVADVGITMSPVLVPMSRGICAVTTAPVESGVTQADIDRVLQEVYGTEPFIRLYPAGFLPATADVVGSNTVGVSAVVDRHSSRVTVVTVMDNLVKGTAGAAVQSLNIALGYPETTGLAVDGVAP
jgi:N-acetyl-gamma-glutamyl-phosphate reductase